MMARQGAAEQLLEMDQNGWEQTKNTLNSEMTYVFYSVGNVVIYYLLETHVSHVVCTYPPYGYTIYPLVN